MVPNEFLLALAAAQAVRHHAVEVGGGGELLAFDAHTVVFQVVVIPAF